MRAQMADESALSKSWFEILSWIGLVVGSVQDMAWQPIGYETKPDGTADPSKPLFNITNPNKLIHEILKSYSTEVMQELQFVTTYIVSNDESGQGRGGGRRQTQRTEYDFEGDGQQQGKRKRSGKGAREEKEEEEEDDGTNEMLAFLSDHVTNVDSAESKQNPSSSSSSRGKQVTAMHGQDSSLPTMNEQDNDDSGYYGDFGHLLDDDEDNNHNHHHNASGDQNQNDQPNPPEMQRAPSLNLMRSLSNMDLEFTLSSLEMAFEREEEEGRKEKEKEEGSS